MPLDAQRKRFNPLQQQKRAERRQYRAGIPHENTAAAPKVCGLAEVIGVNQIVIGGIRLAEHREPVGAVLPRKIPAVDNGPAHRSAVPAHEFRQRMHHDIRAVFDGSEQDWSSDCIVDNQRHAVPVSHAS